MKKILTLISALALGLTISHAQMTGHGDGTGTGDGPFGHNGGMWPYIAENADGDILAAYNTVVDLREVLRTSRAEYLQEHDSLEGWFEQEAENIALLHTNVDLLRDWYRETRPDRPDPVMTGAMQQRRTRFQENSGELVQLRQRLRLASQNDPNSEECNQIREQIRNKLGERKGLLREKRRGEGSQSGDGDRNGRGG